MEEVDQCSIPRNRMRATQMTQVVRQHTFASNKNMPDTQPRQGMSVRTISLSCKATSTTRTSISCLRCLSRR